MSQPLGPLPETPSNRLSVEERLSLLEGRVDTIATRLFNNIEDRVRILEDHAKNLWDKVKTELRKVL